MKCISIQQPWATLIAHGIKDIENRTSRMLVPPQRVLIHVGTRMRDPELLSYLPDCWDIYVQAAEEIGAFDREAPLPLSAIIGYVDIVDIVSDADSPWAQYAEEGEKPFLHYVLRNAKLFKQPILNVKGRLGVWDIPEITEDNLPETVDLPKITLEDGTLTIPCNDHMWQQALAWHNDPQGREFAMPLTLTPENAKLLTDTDGYPIAPETIIFKSKDGRTIATNFVESYIAERTYEDTGEPVTYELPNGTEDTITDIFFAVTPKP